MSVALESRQVNESAAADKPVLDPFDPSPYFERWLAEINPGQCQSACATPENEAEDHSEIFIGSFPGSNCEVSFEGVLHFDGYSIGNITSPEGTLVLTKRGRIEADINVGIAVISGWVTGDITASDHVVLESEARVTGQIRTPALSVRLGAVFDGDCLFTAPEKPLTTNRSSAEQRSHHAEQLAMGARA